MPVVTVDEARAAIGGAMLGPDDIATVLGFDPLEALSTHERHVVSDFPFSVADLSTARANGEFLVLRVPRDAHGPLTMLRLAERLAGGLDPQVAQGGGVLLGGHGTHGAQPLAAHGPRPAGGAAGRRGRPVEGGVVAEVAGGHAGVPGRRSGVEIAWDTLLWHRTHSERLLAGAWDWSRSESVDEGLVALGEFSDKGLGVIAYSRAVRFGTLGVCPQR